MANTFHLKIAIPSKICFEGQIKSAELCSSSGYLTILPNHISIIGNTLPSYFFIKLTDEKKQTIIINNGIFSFDSNEMMVVSDFCEFIDNLDISAIDKRNEIILKALNNSKIDEIRRHEIETRVNITTAKLKQLAKK